MHLSKRNLSTNIWYREEKEVLLMGFSCGSCFGFGSCYGGYGYGGYGGYGSTFVLIVVLFILLIIVGASFRY